MKQSVQHFSSFFIERQTQKLNKHSTEFQTLQDVSRCYMHNYKDYCIQHKISSRNVKLALCLIKHNAMETLWNGDKAQPFMTSALDGNEWSGS
jgi:hypothetical protein